MAPRLVLTAAALAVTAWLGWPADIRADEAQSGSAQAGSAQSGFDPERTEAIREIVREYLLENPEVLIDALEAYDRRRRDMAEQRQRKAIVAHAADLSDDPGSPVLGDPDGDVLVVEFFDYLCPYCKTVAKDLRQAVIADGRIRLVMKEFPILGPQSVHAARAALAAGKQGRYEDFHFALMAFEGKLDEAAVLSVAEALDVDTAQLQKDMFSNEIDETLQRVFALAEALDVRGTPAFVVGDRLVSGALGMEDLRRMVEELRAESG